MLPIVQAQPPYPTYAMPTAPQANVGAVVGGVLLLVLGFVLFAVGGFVSVMTFGGGFAFIVMGMVLFLIGILLIAAGNISRRQLPPPPPIQQPMVPMGMMGQVASLNCPNCGAPPGPIDRYGIATCPHCQTRFLLR